MKTILWRPKLSANVKKRALPVKIDPDPTEKKRTKRRVARQGSNGAAISAHIWMTPHRLQLLCLLPNNVEMPRNEDILISQLA